MIKLAIVGATGAVGQEVVQVLDQSKMKLGAVRFFASAKSVKAGARITFRSEKFRVEDLAKTDFKEFDVAIFCVGSKVSRRYAPIAKAAGCVVIDNSSAFRMDPAVPLVVPEINADALDNHNRIIANPNCTTAIMLMALYPLHQAFGAQWISVTTYQAASGAGARGVAELWGQMVSYAGETTRGDGVWKQRMESDVFPQPIALNVFPHAGTFLDNGYTDEEMKVLNESRKILSHPGLQATTTCGRVPVERVHSMDVLAHFEKPVSVPEALEALKTMSGLDVFEDDDYPTPLKYAHRYNCGVGRVRSVEGMPNALRFWVAGDQLLKGAALNAVQILEHLFP